MTRWARANNVHRKKVSDATPWEDLRKGASQDGKSIGKKGSTGAGQKHIANKLALKKEPQQAKKKKNKKKKDYFNDDVNGFRDFLNQTSQIVQGGKVVAIDSKELIGEVTTALRKDQRREDRRVKRQVTKKNQMLCFHCRKPGHGLADCKEAQRSQEMGAGICYRCGSTEHDINKCRAKVDPALGEFPFAKCFICGEMGHLSRSCPDNPKGLYGAGGSCRSCGSVEHFQRDCPEQQNSGHLLTVGRWYSGMSADYEEISSSSKLLQSKIKAPKVVNF
ncbi:zinc finger CCHC domain-containing protein 9 [Ambystoma mexicanum]|uniref:zinc finger CCHC domain-containing protein 9 n=1 Tax=Ambystoma mexicanum TaxID=8296 RepID=UPI0037E92BDF